jgi:RNA polymerase sigma-70 factor (ECF subfamily)
MAPACETVDAGVLFETYHDRIYRYVLGMVKNSAEAEELMQDTFLRAYRHGDSLRDPEAVRGWLYRIATHVCLDRLRQRRPLVSLNSEEDEDRVKPPVSQSPSPLEVSERKETSACVQRCLDFLPDKYRAVVLLHEAHSLTAPEIAELLGLTVTTVKIRIHRARRKLQKVMECGCLLSEDEQGTPTCRPKRALTARLM